MTVPAIVRAHNPCALRPLARGRWKGQTGEIHIRGGRYCAFEGPVWGVRAALRNLATYTRIHRLTTPEAIVGRWAPAADNNPEHVYARFIARRLGVGLRDPIPATYEANRRLIAAIVRFESGFDAVGPQVIAQAMALMAEEERAAGRNAAPYEAPDAPLKPLSTSKEVAIGGGAVATGIGGAVAYGREAVETAKQVAEAGGDLAEAARGGFAACSGADLAAIGSFALLVLFGAAVLANRFWARFRALR